MWFWVSKCDILFCSHRKFRAFVDKSDEGKKKEKETIELFSSSSAVVMSCTTLSCTGNILVSVTIKKCNRNNTHGTSCEGEGEGVRERAR